ncbi:MAG: hypothetical protein HON91_11215 [Anaerolineae bacterium]|nr:hypothetical protein [Anaerolineae bacterium]
MRFSLRIAQLSLFFTLLACRPVWTVGWTEILIFGIILLVFLGPSLLRFYRRFRKFRQYEREKRE